MASGALFLGVFVPIGSHLGLGPHRPGRAEGVFALQQLVAALLRSSAPSTMVARILAIALFCVKCQPGR